MSLQHLEDDELGELVEAADEGLLLEHLGEDPEDQRPARPLRVVQVLEQHAQHRAEVVGEEARVAGADHPDDAGHGLPPLPAPAPGLDALQGGDQLVQLRLHAVRLGCSPLAWKYQDLKFTCDRCFMQRNGKLDG